MKSNDVNRDLGALLSRRHFLLGSAASTLGWLVKPAIARQIVHLALEHERILTVPIKNPRHILYYITDRDLFCMDDNRGEQTDISFTWRQWLVDCDVDPGNRSALKELAEEHGVEDHFIQNGRFRLPDLDAQAADRLVENYVDWGWSLYDSPEAQAFHYLDRLGLGERLNECGQGLGELRFVESPCPGSNFTYVSASGIEVVSGLQQRLIQLGEEVEVRLV